MYNENIFFEELEKNGIKVNSQQRKQITDRVSQALCDLLGIGESKHAD